MADEMETTPAAATADGAPGEDINKIVTVKAMKPDGEQVNLRYELKRVIGNGSFGVVYHAVDLESGVPIAIKKVLQDRRFKNRELQVMKMLSHPNVVALKHYFYSQGDNAEQTDEVYLNLLLEFVPETVHRVTRSYVKRSSSMPLILVKLFTFQLCRAVSYIHSLGICHRDLKPQNLLVDPTLGILKLCDFGSAKVLVPGEPNVSYICSRYYRAPELIFGSTTYTTAIDTWSLGCVLAEMLLGHPLFPGESGVDQLVEVIKVLGTPSKEDIASMNRSYHEFKFPSIKPYSWSKVFRRSTPSTVIDLVSQLLEYAPEKRIEPFAALAHPFFDELRDSKTTLPDGSPLPDIFAFSESELAVNPALLPSIMPAQQ